MTATEAAADTAPGALALSIPEFGDKALNLLSAARAALADRAEESRLLLMVEDNHPPRRPSDPPLLSIVRDPQVFVIVTLRAGRSRLAGGDDADKLRAGFRVEIGGRVGSSRASFRRTATFGALTSETRSTVILARR